jgi:hypothetical protein
MPQSSTSVQAVRVGVPFRAPAVRRTRKVRSLWRMQRPRRSGGKCRWVLQTATWFHVWCRYWILMRRGDVARMRRLQEEEDQMRWTDEQPQYE